LDVDMANLSLGGDAERSEQLEDSTRANIQHPAVVHDNVRCAAMSARGRRERAMTITRFQFALVVAATVLAVGCGTAETGSGAATSADAQVAPPSEGQPPATTTTAPETGPAQGGDAVVPNLPGRGAGADAPSGGPCASDADCVPAACCHSKTCVAKAQKASCAGTMCTMDCRGGTLDCGGGKCLCKDGVCAAEIRVPDFMKKLEEEKAKAQAQPQ
jgi:hypothetical protein